MFDAKSIKKFGLSVGEESDLLSAPQKKVWTNSRRFEAVPEFSNTWKNVNITRRKFSTIPELSGSRWATWRSFATGAGNTWPGAVEQWLRWHHHEGQHIRSNGGNLKHQSGHLFLLRQRPVRQGRGQHHRRGREYRLNCQTSWSSNVPISTGHYLKPTL